MCPGSVEVLHPLSSFLRFRVHRDLHSFPTRRSSDLALDSELVGLGSAGPSHLRVQGQTTLSGSIDVKSSKNAGVALLCASLLNTGTTVLRKVARIEEVNRLLEVLTSIGVSVRWLNEDNDLEIQVPETLDLGSINVEAARRTRSIIMFLGPLMHRAREFQLPYAGGCDLGTRTVEPHMSALRPFGLSVMATEGHYQATATPGTGPSRPIVLTERGDTVTENTLLAAALYEGETVIRNASPNYMVQDLCFFLVRLGVRIEGIGTTTLRVHGKSDIRTDVDYAPSEDPIEAMSLITAAIVTRSQITVRRVPIEFMEIELATLEEMGFTYERSAEYIAGNGQTRLVDIVTHPSDLRAPIDKIHPMPFPGLNIDNLPFFAVIAVTATGQTLLHDWVYENRAIHGRADQARREGEADGPPPGADRWPHPLERHRDRVSAGAAPGRGDPAGDARRQGHLGAAQRLRHQPGLRGPGRTAERARRPDRDVPRHLSRRPPRNVSIR